MSKTNRIAALPGLKYYFVAPLQTVEHPLTG